MPCNSTMRRSVLPDQVLSPDVSSITSGANNSELTNDSQILFEKEVATKDQTPDMFEENYTKLLMRKQHFKFCWTTQDSTGFSLGDSHDFSRGDESSKDQTLMSFVKHIEDDKLSSFLDVEERTNSQMFESYTDPFTRRTSSQNNLDSQKRAEAECTKQKWYFRNRSSSVGPCLGGKGQESRPNFGFDQIVSPTQVIISPTQQILSPTQVEKATATSFLADDSSEATTSTCSPTSSSSESSTTTGSTLPSNSDFSCQTDSLFVTSFASSSLSLVSSSDSENGNTTKKDNNAVSVPPTVCLKFAADEDTELIHDLKPETIRERRRTQAKEPLYNDTTLPEGWKREVDIHLCQ